MNVMRSALTLGLCFGTVFFSSCASTEAEEESQRREKALVEDNDNLRKQLNDQRSVESALQRELQARNSENSDLRRQNVEVSNTPSGNTDSTPANESPAPRAAAIDTSGLAGKDVQVIDNGNGSATIRLAGATYFKPGQSELTDAGKKILDRIAARLAPQKDVKISVEGHTDATPLNKTKSVYVNNTNLSLARAVAVHDYLGKKSIAAARMRVTGYGETVPLQAGTSKAANEKNRRVELVLSTNM